MDGRPLAGVRAFKVECAPGTVTKITLELTGTASLAGDGQVWVKDATTQELTDRADVAETRADVAEARADAAEANGPDIDAGTMVYIVPVPQEARDAAEGKTKK